MGHAGAIISGNVGTAQGKIDALSTVGATIAETPWDIPKSDRREEFKNLKFKNFMPNMVKELL